MMKRRSWPLLLFCVFATLSTARAQAPNIRDVSAAAAYDVRADAAAAKPITLQDAVAIALEKNPLRKAAVADEKLAAAGVREAKSTLLPHLMFSEGATRGNDPVYAFGTRLRQGRFTMQDFALNRLNTPLPIGNFTTRLSGQWNLFQAADWLNVRRAEDLKRASAQQLERTDQETVLRVINAYYGLLLATKQQELAAQQVQTSASILHFSKARYESGLVIEADYLAAQVNHSSRQQDLIRANNAVSLARVQLSSAMGMSADLSYAPTDALAERAVDLVGLPEAEQRALASRPDLKQIEMQQRIAETGTRMAKSAFAPRVSAFAGWEQDNPAMFSGGNNNWVSGVEVQVDLFTGGQKTAQLQRARAMEEKMAALRQAAIDNVRLEVRKAWYEADAARQQLAVARSAIAQSEESLRIHQTRYQSGLSTITDLLRAEESTRRTRTDYWQAVYGSQTSFANLELAMGTLSPASPVVQ